MGPSWCCRVQPEAKQVITGDYEYLKKPVVGCSAHRAFVKGVHQLVEWDSLLYGVCQATIEKPYRRPLRANVCREYHGPYIHIEYHICSASFQNTLLGVARDGKKNVVSNISGGSNILLVVLMRDIFATLFI